MPDIEDLITVIEEQRQKVRAIKDLEITELAEDIAYYTAMLDAAADDPFEEDDKQEAVLTYLVTTRQEAIERYQTLVNSHL